MDRALCPALGAGLWYRTHLARLRDALRLRAGVPHEEHRELVPVRVGGAEPGHPRYAKRKNAVDPCCGRSAGRSLGFRRAVGRIAGGRRRWGRGARGVLILFFVVA